jgi:hypothetical protein
MKTKAATDVSLRKRKGVVLAPSRENSLHRAPDVSSADSRLAEKAPEPKWLGYETEADFDEAVENFLAYLEILREWDAKDKAADDGPPLQFPDD